MVSRTPEKPCRTVKPVTLAVIDPRLTAARALVDKCPIETTGTMTREYSNRCVLKLHSCQHCLAVRNSEVVIPKYWQRVLDEDAKFLPEHDHAAANLHRSVPAHFLDSGNGWRDERSIFVWWSAGFGVSLRIEIWKGSSAPAGS
jgi:hypothetical protein